MITHNSFCVIISVVIGFAGVVTAQEKQGLYSRSIDHRGSRLLDVSRLHEYSQADVGLYLRSMIVDWRVVSGRELAVLDGMFAELPKGLPEERSVENTFMVIRLSIPKRARPALLRVKFGFRPVDQEGPVHRAELFPLMKEGVCYAIVQLRGDYQTHGIGPKLQAADWEFWIEKVTFAGA